MLYNGGMVEQVRKRGARKWIGLGVALILIVAVAVAVVLNRQWIYDWWRGLSYQPTGEMGRIMEDLKLTGRGEFLLKATRPTLSESGEFNAECRDDADAEVAVLGCYTEGDIYVYNITEKELAGIRELTTAHELLHAVWERMPEEERRALTAALTKTFEMNQELLKSELATYDVNERQEELYVRAGTEVADLPAELEKHYAEIFVDQDLVVGFYNAYIVVFREIEAEMDGLMSEMEGLRAEMDNLTAEYERRVKQFNANVVSFNSCAAVAGCFKSEAEFYSRRAGLLAEQDALGAMYDEIGGIVDRYNALVEQYNADVTRTEKLNQAINSNDTVKGLD